MPLEPPRAFSLPRFMPLLYERITVLNPWTRTFLISWLVVLNSVPDLELVSYLPDFLEGLLMYLGDPTYEVRTQTEILLEVLLREVGSVREVQLELLRTKREAWDADTERRRRRVSEAKTVTVTDHDEEEEADTPNGKEPPAVARPGDSGQEAAGSEDAIADSDEEADRQREEEEDASEWTPGQGVKIDYPAIVEILIRFVSAPGKLSPATALKVVELT